MRTPAFHACFVLAFAASPFATAGPNAGVPVDLAASPTGAAADAWSDSPCVSKSGRWVAFITYASNVADPPGNGVGQVVLLDRKTGAREYASISAGGAIANADCNAPAISGDGRYVVFQSAASNLVPSDNLGQVDVFRFDRVTGAIVRASLTSSEAAVVEDSREPAISADGRFVAFCSSAIHLASPPGNGEQQVYLRDMDLGTTVRVSVATLGAQAAEFSSHPSVSADGSLVAFQSAAQNLGSPNAYGGSNVWLRNVAAGTTSLVSEGLGGTPVDGGSYEPAISPNGRFVAYSSYATNLVADDGNGSLWDVFVLDRHKGFVERLTRKGPAGQDASVGAPSISANGRYVAATAEYGASDGSGQRQAIVLFDRKKGTKVLLPRDAHGHLADVGTRLPRISGNGKILVFESGDDALDGVPDSEWDVFALKR